MQSLLFILDDKHNHFFTYRIAIFHFRPNFSVSVAIFSPLIHFLFKDKRSNLILRPNFFKHESA